MCQNEDIGAGFQKHNTTMLYLGEAKLCRNDFLMMPVKVNNNFFFFFYSILLYCIGFAIHWHESTTGVHEFPIWTPSPLPPHIISLDHPRAPAPSILYPASNIDWRFVSYMIVYMFQCHSPKSSHPLPLESKSPLYTSVSFLVSCIQGHHCHLSKFPIYVLVYYIGVFLSGLLHSV